MSKFTAFLFGGLVGAGLALAFAPQSGDKTRAMVQERANALAGEAKSFADNMPDALQDAYQNVVTQGTNIVNNATAKMKEVTGASSVPEDADELRAKIEAARQRIATQVMENAEQSKTIAGNAAAEVKNLADKADVAADAAADELKDKAAEEAAK